MGYLPPTTTYKELPMSTENISIFSVKIKTKSIDTVFAGIIGPADTDAA